MRGACVTMEGLRGRAVIICPRLPERNPIEALRRRFDPLVDVIRAHITLVFPFESDLAPDDLRAHIADAVRGIGPFPIRLAGITGSDGRFLFVNVKRGNDALIELQDRLYTGPLLRYRTLTFTFAPHVTVGRLPTDEAFAAALAAAVAEAPIDIETSATSLVVYAANSHGSGAIETELRL
jgi:2'-5' RNA ligase